MFSSVSYGIIVGLLVNNQTKTKNTMKKIMLTATALLFTVAMFAQTGSAPVKAKSPQPAVVVQNTTKPSAGKDETKGKEEKKKECKKGNHCCATKK